MDLEQYRAYFPHLSKRVYLDHAAVSPLPLPVRRAVEEQLRDRSEGKIADLESLLYLMAELRRELAGMVHAESPDSIAFVPNTSTGLNILAQGIDWQKGDRILVTDCEFPANIYPYLNLADRGVTVDFVPCIDGAVPTDHLLAHVRPQTRLVSLSLVEFLSGYRHDARKIGNFCRENGILFALDAIQGLGAVEVDVQAWKVDFLASGGQKWLLSPMGSGFIYVSPGLLPALRVSYPGWLSVKDAWNFFDYRLDYLPTAERFEPGTKPVLPLRGMLAAVRLLRSVPDAERERRILDLSGYLIRELKQRGIRVITPEDGAHRAGIVTFEAPGDAEKIHQELKEAGVDLSFRSGMLRASPHFYNTEDDLNRLLSRLEKHLA